MNSDLNSHESNAAPKPAKTKSRNASLKLPKPRQDAVKKSLFKKKEFEDSVFAVMQRHLFEGTVDSQTLKNLVATYLEPKHYEAVVQERVANRICGYPVCDNNLKKLEGRYRISLSTQKVFDISPLKNFCCKEHLAASRYLATQIPHDPGYMRNVNDVLERLEILDLNAIDSITKELQSPTSPAAKESPSTVIFQSQLKSLLKSLPTPATATPLFNPTSLVISENPNASCRIDPPTKTVSHKDERLEAAEMVEGFRVSPVSAQHQQKVIRTDLLKEYEEKRRIREQQSNQQCRLKSKPLNGSNIDHTVVNGSVRGSAGESIPKSKKRVSFSASDPNSKRIDANHTNTPHTETSEVDDDEGEDCLESPTENDIFLMPSKRSIAKLTNPANLSHFGRLWNLLGMIVTRETVRMLQDRSSVDMDAFYMAMFEGGVDMDAVVTRGRIFSEKMLKCVSAICKRHTIKTPLHKDMAEFLSTLLIRESSVVLNSIDEKILCITFLKMISDSQGGSLQVEVTRNILNEDCVRVESCGHMNLAEIKALSRCAVTY